MRLINGFRVRAAIYFLIVVICLLSTYFIWVYLNTKLFHSIKKDTLNSLASLQHSMKQTIERNIYPLQQMASRWEIRGGVPKKEWEADANNIINDHLSYQAIEFVDTSYYIRWVIPITGNEKAQNLYLAFEKNRKEALNTSKESKSLIVDETIDLVQGGKGFLVFVPIYSYKKFDGFILGVFRIDKLFDRLFNTKHFNHLNIEIYENDNLIFSKDNNIKGNNRYQSVSKLNYNNISWTVVIRPDQYYIDERSSYMPYVVLLFGLTFSLLLMIVFFLLLITEKKSSYLKKVTKTLNMVYHTISSIAESNSVDNAIKDTIRNICIKFNWKIGHAYILDEKKQLLVSSNIWFIDSGFINQAQEFKKITAQYCLKKGIGLPGRVWNSHNVEFIYDILKDKNFPRIKLCKYKKLHSAFAFPIYDKKKLVYVLEFFTDSYFDFDDSFVKTLSVFSRQISQIMNQRRIEVKIRHNEEKYRAIISNAVDPIIMINNKGIIQEFNIATTNLLGYKKQELINNNVSMIMPEPHATKHDQYLKEYLTTGVTNIIGKGREVLAKHKSTLEIPVWLSISEIQLNDETYFIGTLRDLSKEKEYEKKLENLANNDHLTGLKNRYFFDQSLEEHAARSKRYDRPFSLMLLDLDGFKAINDSLGHDVGDEVLKEVADRLLKIIRKNDVLSRLGGDEFAIILEGIDKKFALESISNKILNTINKSFYINSDICNLSVSIGISSFPRTTIDLKALLKYADNAMYIAKKSDTNWFFMKILNRSLVKDNDIRLSKIS